MLRRSHTPTRPSPAPTRNGTRQPHASSWTSDSVLDSRAPSRDATSTEVPVEM